MAMMAIEVIRISTSLRVVSEVILVSIPTQPLPIATVFEVFWKLRAHENFMPFSTEFGLSGRTARVLFYSDIGHFYPHFAPTF